MVAASEAVAAKSVRCFKKDLRCWRCCAGARGQERWWEGGKMWCFLAPRTGCTRLYVATAVRKEQLQHKYFESLQEASEGSSGEFCSLRSAPRSSVHCLRPSTGEQQGSSGVVIMSDLSLINTEAVSGLSSSKFLVDHTQLQFGRGQDCAQENLQGRERSPGRLGHSLDHCEENVHHLSHGQVGELLPQVDQNGKVQVEGFLKVLLDTPAPNALTLSSCPIRAAIGVVKLEILRTPEPLTVEAAPHQTGSTHLTLKNASSLPLSIHLMIKDHCRFFSVLPSRITMSPGSCTSPAVVFTPGASRGALSSVLVVRVEPDGMEFEISVSGVCRASSQPSSSVPAPSLVPPPPPPVAPCSASIPVSASVPTGHPVHKEMQKIHAQVARSNSDPLSKVPASGAQYDEKSLSSALESTKSHLVFGTVALGATGRQKVVLRNTLAARDLPLSLTITGSQAFQVCVSGSEAGLEKLEVVVKPSQEFLLMVLLRPSTVEPLMATLVCRHRSQSDHFKWKIPLQGYGGRGELKVKDINVGQPFIIKDLCLGLPNILQTAVTNTGQRTLFVALQLFSDKHCKELAADLSVQPTRVLVNPGETEEVYIVASSTARQLAKTPGLIGVFQATSVEEILRRRYRRMKSKEVKGRRINNPDLLKFNWVEKVTGEQEAQLEPDILPPQAEDAVVFFNSCVTTRVEVWGEQRPSDDHSSTVFACLAGEQTVADFTASQVESAIVPQSSPTVSWDVLPQTLTVQAGAAPPQVIFVVNFTSTEQMLEVCSSCKWVQVEPREAVLAGHSSVQLCVTACPPHTLTSPTTCSLVVMGENESRCATVTVLPSATEREAATSCPSTPSAPETKEAQESPVQLASDDLTFPDTPVSQESHVKVTLKNLDQVVHTVEAAVTLGPFVVRHTRFSIKSGHYVNVPVYFRPQRAGPCTGRLQMTLLRDGLVLPVRLSGRASP